MVDKLISWVTGCAGPFTRMASLMQARSEGGGEDPEQAAELNIWGRTAIPDTA